MIKIDLDNYLHCGVLVAVMVAIFVLAFLFGATVYQLYNVNPVVDLGESVVVRSGSIVGFNDSSCAVVDGFVYCELESVVCEGVVV